MLNQPKKYYAGLLFGFGFGLLLAVHWMPAGMTERSMQFLGLICLMTGLSLSDERGEARTGTLRGLWSSFCWLVAGFLLMLEPLLLIGVMALGALSQMNNGVPPSPGDMAFQVFRLAVGTGMVCYAIHLAVKVFTVPRLA